MPQKLWYYEAEGEKKGPVLEDELSKLILDKSLLQHSLVWQEGMSDWIKISEIDVFKVLYGPPPLPISHIPSGYIVSVVTLPIWGSFIQLIICSIFAKGNDDVMWKYYDNNFWFLLFIVINTIFCSIDSSNLKKSGSNVPVIWAAFLVPVYIYKRGTELMKIHGGDYIKNQMYFFFWIFSFILSMIIEMQLRG